MAYDARSGFAYLLAMDVTQPAATSAIPKQDPLFHPDTFTVLGVRIE